MSIKTKAQELQDQLVQWRRQFHTYPEVGLHLPKTEAFVADTLRAMGLKVQTGVGNCSGVVGILEGAKPGKTFAVRADMDALSITEETGLEFASQHPGKMHACGHDGHMAIALGAARLLSEMKEELPGKVKFIFQPAEEGPGGAKPMIEDGVMEGVDAIMALHLGIWNVPVGHVGIKRGAMMASMDKFEIEIIGKGGHGAMPHMTVDAVCVAGHVITELQTIVSRKVSPVEPAVITVGSVHSGTAFNIIAERAAMEGTTRALNEDIRKNFPQWIESVVGGVCQGMGADYKFKYSWGYPSLHNDAEFADFFQTVAEDLLGPDQVHQLPEPTMGGEDMAYFLQKAPGIFFCLGIAGKDGIPYPHHNPRFDIDESALWTGSALLAEAAQRWLTKTEN